MTIRLTYFEKKEQELYEQEVAAYREELTATLAEEYGRVKIVEYYNLTENEETPETVCVFRREDGCFGAVFYFTYTDTDTNATWLIMNGIGAATPLTIPWYVYGPCCGRAIWFRIYDTQAEIPENSLHATAMTDGESTRYLCVTGIEP